MNGTFYQVRRAFAPMTYTVAACGCLKKFKVLSKTRREQKIATRHICGQDTVRRSRLVRE
jgi:hypothetical protein